MHRKFIVITCLNLQIYAGAADGNIKLKLFILCGNSIEAVGRDLKYPDKAMLSAAVIVIPQEYPNIDVKLIDLDDDDFTCSDKISQNIYNEICSNNEDKVVVYRRYYRMLPIYRALSSVIIKKLYKKKVEFIFLFGWNGWHRSSCRRAYGKESAIILSLYCRAEEILLIAI